MPSELSDAELEVRDITTNPYWEKKYGLVIPILIVNQPGSEDEVNMPSSLNYFHYILQSACEFSLNGK